MTRPMDANSRRQFLKGSSALMLGLGAAGLSQFSQAQRAGDYWGMVRAQFSFEESAVPMNAANLCPAFRAVTERGNALTADIDRDCSFVNRSKFTDMLEDSRRLVAAQLGVDADEVALVRNTSEANNIINGGLPLTAGDEVIVWDQNHPTNNVAWDVRAARYNLRITRVRTPAQPRTRDELLNAFVSRFSANTRVLSLTHVSNVSGVRLPVAELVEAAHERGIHVHVDGAQTWGAMELDLRELNVDSFSASAHKWYMGPKEVGLLFVKAEHIERIWPSVVAPGWGDDADTDLRGARKFESLGQRDDAALAALGTAAMMHDQIGPRRIEKRITDLAQRLKRGIRDHGLELITPMDEELSHGVCITRVRRGNGGEINNRLYNEFGIAGAPTGGLRLCPTIYNTEAHIDRAIAALGELLA